MRVSSQPPDSLQPPNVRQFVKLEDIDAQIKRLEDRIMHETFDIAVRANDGQSCCMFGVVGRRWTRASKQQQHAHCPCLFVALPPRVEAPGQPRVWSRIRPTGVWPCRRSAASSIR